MMTYTTYMSSLACINRGGKMIHNFCYSHLIMINTLYTCTVQVRVQYTTVQYKVYYYYLLGSILFGGACTLYSTECIIIFCLAQFYLGGGGLSPPSHNDAPPLQVNHLRDQLVDRDLRLQTATTLE